MVDRICVSSSGEDWESWFPWTSAVFPTRDDWERMTEPLRTLSVWDARHPACVETWPEVRAANARRFGWPDPDA